MIYFISKQKSNIPKLDLNSTIDFLNSLLYISIDTETTGLCPHVNKPILLILGNKNSQIVIDLRTELEFALNVLNAIKDKIFIGANLKFDHKMLKSIGYSHYNYIDVMNMALVIYNGYKYHNNTVLKYSLETLLDRHLGIKITKEQRNSFIGKPDSELFIIGEITYAAKDIEYLEELFYRLLKFTEKYKLDYLLSPDNYNLEGKFVAILGDIEYVGVEFNKELWLKNAEKVRLSIVDIEKSMNDMIKNLSNEYKRLKHIRKYNFNSNDNIFYIFEATGEIINFPIREDLEEYISNKTKKLKEKQLKKSEVTIGKKSKNKVIGYVNTLFNVEDVVVKLDEKEKYSFGEEYLNQYLEENQDSILVDFITLLLKYREGSKLFSTYGESFTDNLNIITKKIHTTYSQCRTLTGRLSSSKPNIQNIPQTNDLRNCFTATEGYSFVVIDYDRQELVILASQSKDGTLLKALNEGLDLHSYLAQGSYRIIKNDNNFIVTDKINKECRKVHKPVLFGYLYGAGAKRVSKVLNIPLNVAKKVVDNLSNLLPGAAKFLNKVRDESEATLEIRDGSKSNRKRIFQNIATHSLRKQAGNFRMQSTGASMVKEALIETDVQLLRPLRHKYPYTYCVMQEHDEGVFQIPDETLEYLPKQIHDIWVKVGNSYLEGVCIDAEYKVSKYWLK